MKKINHQKGGDNATVLNVLWGILLSLCASIVLCVLLTAFIEKEVLSITTMGTGVLVVNTVSAFAGSMLSTALEKGKPAVICGIVCAGYIGVLLCINLLFFSSGFNSIVSTILATVVGGAAACAVKIGISSNPKKRKKTFVR